MDKFILRRIRLYSHTLAVLCHQLEEITAPALYDQSIDINEIEAQISIILDNMHLLQSAIDTLKEDKDA